METEQRNAALPKNMRATRSGRQARRGLGQERIAFPKEATLSWARMVTAV